MKLLNRWTVVLALFPGLGFAATHINPRASDPSVYYNFIFTQLGDPEIPPQSRAAFEKDYVRMNHLNTADVAALRAGAEEFGAALEEVRAKAVAIAEADEDGHATHALNVAFRGQTADIGSRY